MTSLHDTLNIGSQEFKNRVFMAPLTRNRASEGDVPTEINATYYGQRASSGLIISEATQISPQGKGYVATPGIYSDAQVEGWQKVTKAVHDKDGKIYCQLWHVGRISHTSLQEDSKPPVAPSAVRADAKTHTAEGEVDVSEPVALDIQGIQNVVQDFAHAARCAREAGFDGVEIHAANGYLLDQFLRDGSNIRTDEYGGSAANRARLLFQVVEAVASVWHYDAIGVRLSPTGNFNDMKDSDPKSTFSTVIEGLNQYNLGYLHMVEEFPSEDASNDDASLLKHLRSLWHGAYIANGGYSAKSGEEAIASGYAQAITYGRPYIANPDLAERFRHNAPLNEPDPSTFYGGSEEGYTDYPFLQDTKAA